MSGTFVRIFPIPQSALDQEYNFFEHYSWRGLQDLESLNDVPYDPTVENVVPYHRDLGVRSGVMDETARHQEAYRAGVFVGTVLLRHRIRLLKAAGEDIVLPAHDGSTIDWSAMRASRFLLSTLIKGSDGDNEFDPKPVLRKLERAWDVQESLDHIDMDGMAMNGLEASTPDDWVVIGMGDLLALYADRDPDSRALLRTTPLLTEPSKITM